MKLALVTDTWTPDVNGVAVTLVELTTRLRARGHDVQVVEPSTFRRVSVPGTGGFELAWRPARRLTARLDAVAPEALHIATEGPLGWAARRHALARGWAFTTAFHTRMPEILTHALRLPVGWGYAAFRRFHAPSAGVLVPTDGAFDLLRRHGFQRLRAWSHGVDVALFRPVAGADLGLPRPVWLYVGRLSPEKNLDAFLSLDLPGSKVVYGAGPGQAGLQQRHPGVHWGPVVPRGELPRLYSAADVFVFPGRSETFGLVMLEAMACGTPVAAFPVPGPQDVVGDSGGGVLHADLRTAALRALELPRGGALARASRFDWERVCDEFMGFLVPTRATPGLADRHEAVAKPS